MKVVVVEDDPGTRMYMVESVRGQGYDVDSASDGVQGLDLVRETEPDLVFLDIQLPGIDGLDILRAMREERIDSIVVVNTAYGSEDYAIQALRLHANDYLKKPVRHSELIPMLEKYAAVVAARSAPSALPGYVLERSCRVEMQNRIGEVAAVAEYLTAEGEMHRRDHSSIGVTLGLVELLNNAIEHGNLGITSEEKTFALEAAPDAYRKLIKERLDDPVIAQRRVRVELTSTHAHSEWTIRDEGDGFDWKTVMDTIDTPDPLALHGRGVFLATCYFDVVEYSGSGNTVRVRKLKTGIV